jgi:hypothetical protein
MWSLSSGGSTGAGPPGASDTVTFDGSTCVGGTTCTTTVNATITVTSISFGSCSASTTGCIIDFSANNNDVTLSGGGNALNGSGSGTRNFKMGNGTWTFTSGANATLINFSVTTSLTFNAGTSNIVFSGNTTGGGAKTITTTGATVLTFNKLTLTGTGATYLNSNNNNTTIGTLALGGGSFMYFNNGVTHIINTISTTSSISSFARIMSPTWNSPITINSASGTKTFSWLVLSDIAFGGGATWNCTSCIDGGDNSGVTITTPVAGGGGCVIGGWLLWRDMPQHLNDNFPAWIDKAA